MGYGGKFVERDQAKDLRAQSWTLKEIADELGVSKSTVSVWVRDVEFVARPRNRGHSGHQPHPLHLRKLQEIERCRTEADELFETLTARRSATVRSGSVRRRRKQDAGNGLDGEHQRAVSSCVRDMVAVRIRARRVPASRQAVPPRGARPRPNRRPTGAGFSRSRKASSVGPTERLTTHPDAAPSTSLGAQRCCTPAPSRIDV